MCQILSTNLDTDIVSGIARCTWSISLYYFEATRAFKIFEHNICVWICAPISVHTDILALFFIFLDKWNFLTWWSCCKLMEPVASSLVLHNWSRIIPTLKPKREFSTSNEKLNEWLWYYVRLFTMWFIGMKSSSSSSSSSDEMTSDGLHVSNAFWSASASASSPWGLTSCFGCRERECVCVCARNFFYQLELCK